MKINIGKNINLHVGTVFDYIKEYGRLSFAEKPFCEIDSLILSQFSYLKLDGIVPMIDELGKSVNLLQMKEHPRVDHLFADERWRKENMALFSAMAGSRRFQNMRCNYHVNIIDTEKETQFSAVTIVLDDGTVYVAFRGTDETLVGWKEDLNMMLEGSVPGQRMSADYLNQISTKIRCPFYVGGHSKGGNLAVYSAVHCYNHVRGMILGVYDHDGPGFRDDITQLEGYREIVPILHKTIPNSSIVGVLLNRNTNCKIIASKNPGAMAHDPFSWLITDDTFLEYHKLKGNSKRAGKFLSDIVAALSEEEIDLMINTIYQILRGSEEDNLVDLQKNLRHSLKNMNKALRDVDDETWKKIREIVRQFIEYSVFENFDKKC